MSKQHSEDLFHLIKSLSRTEKRYFKVFAGNTNSNNSILLFDYIDSLEKYDEGILKKKIKDNSITKHLSTNKKRLYESLMKSLSVYHSNSSIDAKLMKGLHNVEILYKKALYTLSLKELKQVRELAEEYAKNTILMEVNRWEKLLLEKDNYENIEVSDIDLILEFDQEISDKVHLYNKLWNTKSHVFYSLNRKGKPRSSEELEKFKGFIDKNLLQIEKQHHTHETQYLFHHIYSAYYFSIGDYQNCYDHLKKNIEHIESNQKLFEEEPNIYFSILTNAIYISSSLKKYNESFTILTKLRTFKKKVEKQKNEDLSLKLFSSTYSIELSLYSMRGDFEKGVKIVPEIITGIKKYQSHLNSVRKAYFYFKIAEMYIGTNNFNEAQKWINKLLNDIDISEKEDIFCFAKLLNLIIYIELENDRLIPYALKSAYRYLKSRNRVYKFETIVFKFIRKVLRVKTDKQLDKAYHYLNDELTILKRDDFEKNAFEYFDFQTWAESKITGESFNKLIKKKNQ